MTHKIPNWSFVLLFLLIGCKKNVSSSLQGTDGKMEKVLVDETDKGLVESTRKNDGLSLVISCGSGCAMTYNAKTITRIGWDIKVIFAVDMFINEVLSETYDEAHIFSYNSSHKLVKIIRVGDGDEDFLKTQSLDTQRSFKDFAVDLVSKNMPFQMKEE